ncbi:cell division protein FtsI (penicillin-binding protein 3) [Frigoribacterium sp. PhB160]|uniref:peptidoglycan D,D-transpeptidase FtsI family protein n=1 Tax=Frigoribacterium sp. PhB160 TaxID=2485192 RepID=UPI000FA404A3|nr:penicillin-binding protein 2 [Frigoribacterium sp. PhB160]ROS62498.1 cell division protein FtsI (penicillin-binding protein 3) [Frigoribacterium sp. PhB160]
MTQAPRSGTPRSRSVRSRRLRATLAMAVVIALTGVFVVRLADIQIVQASELNEQSKDKREITQVTYGDRGTITASDGTVLAGSVTRYNVTAAPAFAKDVTITTTAEDGTKTKSTMTVDDVLAKVADITGGDAAAMSKAVRDDPEANFAYLVKGVDVDAFRAVRELKASGVSWLYFERQSARSYPNGSVAGNLTGFIGTDGPQAGLEMTADSCLAGTDGEQVYERGADGVQLPGSTVTMKEAVAGGTLKLTIDSDLEYMAQQAIAEQAQAIGAESATAVVQEVKTGKLLAVADWPAVDPNDVNLTKDVNDLGSRAFTASYEPGSTFKAMTAAMLLDSGKATATSQATVPYSRTFPWGGEIHDATFHPTEKLTLTGILRDSSNVGISLLGQNLSAQQRHDYMVKFGLNEPTAVGFLGEPTQGIRPAAQWDQQTSINTMFGQGVSTTAVHIAGVFQTLGNHGLRLPTQLVDSCTAADGTVSMTPTAEPVQAVSPAAADTTVNMIESVVTDGDLSDVLTIPGYRVAAKTGTAEVAGTDGSGYGSDRIVSVAGIAPAEDPQYVVVVTFTKPSTMKTSAAAAPTFNKIMSQVLEMYRVPPSTEPAPDIPQTW